MEDKANGSAVIETMVGELDGVLAVEPQGGKVARAYAVEPQVEAGQVFLPADAPWVGDFIEECAAFPNGKNDDQVDQMTQALTRMHLREGDGWVPTVPTEEREDARNEVASYRSNSVDM